MRGGDVLQASQRSSRMTPAATHSTTLLPRELTFEVVPQGSHERRNRTRGTPTGELLAHVSAWDSLRVLLPYKWRKKDGRDSRETPRCIRVTIKTVISALLVVLCTVHK